MFSTWSGGNSGRSDPILEARQLAATGTSSNSDDSDSDSTGSSDSSDSDDSGDEGIIGKTRHPFWSNLLPNRSFGSGMTNFLDEIEQGTSEPFSGRTADYVADTTLLSKKTNKTHDIAMKIPPSDSLQIRDPIPQRTYTKQAKKSVEKVHQNTKTKLSEGIPPFQPKRSTVSEKNENKRQVRDDQRSVKYSQNINSAESYRPKNSKSNDGSKNQDRSTKESAHNSSSEHSNYSGHSHYSVKKTYPKTSKRGETKISSGDISTSSGNSRLKKDSTTRVLPEKTNERKSQHHYASDESKCSGDPLKSGKAGRTKKVMNKESLTFRDDISQRSRTSRRSLKSSTFMKPKRSQAEASASLESKAPRHSEDSSQSTKSNQSKTTWKKKSQKTKLLPKNPHCSSERSHSSVDTSASNETNDNNIRSKSREVERSVSSQIDDTTSAKDHLSANESHSSEKSATKKYVNEPQSHASDVSHHSDTSNRSSKSMSHHESHQVDGADIQILTRVDSKRSSASEDTSVEEVGNVEVQILPSDQSHISDLSSPSSQKSGNWPDNNNESLTRKQSCSTQSSNKSNHSGQSITSEKEENSSPSLHDSRSRSGVSLSEVHQARSRSETSFSEVHTTRSRSETSSVISESRSRSEASHSSDLQESRSRSNPIDWHKEVHDILESKSDGDESEDELSTDWVQIAKEIEMKEERQREKEKQRLAQQRQQEKEELERKQLADEELRKLEEKEWKLLGSEIGHVMAGAEGALVSTVGSALVCQDKTLTSNFNAQRGTQIESKEGDKKDDSEWQKIGDQVASIWSRLKSNSTTNPLAWIVGSVLVVSTCGGCGYMFDSHARDYTRKAIQQNMRTSGVRRLEAPVLKNDAKVRGSVKKKSGFRRFFARNKETRGRNQYQYVEPPIEDNGRISDFRDEHNVDERNKEYNRGMRQPEVEYNRDWRHHEAEIRNNRRDHRNIRQEHRISDFRDENYVDERNKEYHRGWRQPEAEYNRDRKHHEAEIRNNRRDNRNIGQEHRVVPYVSKDLIIECVKDHLECVDDSELKATEKRAYQDLPKQIHRREEAPLMYIPNYHERNPPKMMAKRKKRRKKRTGVRKLFFQRRRKVRR